MRLSASLLILSVAGLPVSAFVRQQGGCSGERVCKPSLTKYRSSISSPLHAMSDAEIAALREQAAKAREEANRLAKELGKDIDEPKKVDVIPKVSLSKEEVSKISGSIDFAAGDAVAQVQKLDSLVEEGKFGMWKKATREPTVSTALFRSLRPYPVSLNMLSQRTGDRITGESLGVGGDPDVNLDDFKDATIAVTLGSTALAIAALALLPENVGATVCYLIALVPVAWIGIGSSSPQILAGAIMAARGDGESNEDRDDRICRHEAAHFLCGYLCGLPVKQYSLLEDSGLPCVEFHVSAEGEISNRELEPEEIATMSVVAMSGAVAEAMKFEQARGGENDLLQLESLFRRSKEFYGAAKQQDLTRWGALTSYQLLNDHRSVYESLVDAFKSKKSVMECVAIVEGSC